MKWSTTIHLSNKQNVRSPSAFPEFSPRTVTVTGSQSSSQDQHDRCNSPGVGDRAGVSVMISPHPGCRVRYYGALLLENRCENRRGLEHHNEQVSTVVTRLTRTWDVLFCNTYQLQWIKFRCFPHSFLKHPNLCWKWRSKNKIRNVLRSFLTFIGPCIVIYSYNETNEMH